MRIKEVVLSYLGEHHPEWIGFYELRRINRRAGLIEVEVKPVQAVYDMALGLRLIIDPERCQVIHLLRKEEMVEPKPTGIISQEEAFQRIAPHLNTHLYYGVKELTHAPNAVIEEAQLFPVYKIESHYLVDAINSRLVRME